MRFHQTEILEEFSSVRLLFNHSNTRKQRMSNIIGRFRKLPFSTFSTLFLNKKFFYRSVQAEINEILRNVVRTSPS